MPMGLRALFRRSKAGKPMAPIPVTLVFGLKSWKIDVEEDATVRLVKEFIARQEDVVPEDLTILFRGRERKDEERLSSIGVRKNSKLQAALTSAGRARKGDPFAGVAGTSAPAAAAAAASPPPPARSSADLPRAAVVRGAAGGAAGAAAGAPPPPSPPPPPPPPSTPAGRLAAITAAIDDLAAQAAAILPPGTVVDGRIPPPEESTALVVAGPPALPAPPPAPDAAQAALRVSELLTQKLLLLDDVDVHGDPELRAARKAEINRVNGLCDALDKWRAGGP